MSNLYFSAEMASGGSFEANTIRQLIEKIAKYYAHRFYYQDINLPVATDVFEHTKNGQHYWSKNGVNMFNEKLEEAIKNEMEDITIECDYASATSDMFGRLNVCF